MERSELTYIALGSNLGDRLENLTHARELVRSFVHITGESGVYETPPWGVVEQPLFFNQVIKGITQLPPLWLLNHLKSVERQMGRVKSVRFGPRIIDLDILLYGERTISYKRLQVPHPRMLDRAFVLVPLAELSPDLVIPGGKKPVQELLAGIDQDGIIKIDQGK